MSATETPKPPEDIEDADDVRFSLRLPGELTKRFDKIIKGRLSRNSQIILLVEDFVTDAEAKQ